MRSDKILKMASNSRVKNALMIGLGEQMIQSKHPEYYAQAIRVINALEPSETVVGLLSCRHFRDEIGEILGLTSGTVTHYRTSMLEQVRKIANSEAIKPGLAVLPYYMGMVNIDLYNASLENI